MGNIIGIAWSLIQIHDWIVYMFYIGITILWSTVTDFVRMMTIGL